MAGSGFMNRGSKRKLKKIGSENANDHFHIDKNLQEVVVLLESKCSLVSKRLIFGISSRKYYCNKH